MTNSTTTYHLIDSTTKEVIKIYTYAQRTLARKRRNKLDIINGRGRYFVKAVNS